MPGAPANQVQVEVYDFNNTPLTTASVRLTSNPEAAGHGYRLAYGPDQGFYVATDVRPGEYILIAEAEGLDLQKRTVQITPNVGLQAIFILGTAAHRYFYRGKVRVPFVPSWDILALRLQPKAVTHATPQVIALALRHQLTPFPVPGRVKPPQLLVFSFPSEMPDEVRARAIQELAKIPGVSDLGLFVHLDDESLSFLTDQFVVKFNRDVSPARAETIAAEYKLTRLRRLIQAENTFLFRFPGPLSYSYLEIAERLVGSGLVEYAEPDLISTMIADAVEPKDFLYPMQWHLEQINCPKAWGFIEDNCPGCPAYGSPDIIIAVVDTGVDLSNSDFKGKVSSGDDKVFLAYDFEGMRPDNNTRTGGHGTCCAGIATALPNNPTNGEGKEGGGCGVAGNCRLMAIEHRRIISDSEWSDMYLWIAGFTPLETSAGFPPALQRGADVITTSVEIGGIAAPAGQHVNAFEKLATDGRGGKGVLLFFSSGNKGISVTEARSQVINPHVFLVGATTLVLMPDQQEKEQRALYSNFGGSGFSGLLDFTTPSGSDLPTLYNPPQSCGIVTTADTDTTSLQFDNMPPNSPSNGSLTTHTTGKITIPGIAIETTIAVQSTKGFEPSSFIIVGSPSSKSAEFAEVTKIQDDTHLIVTGLRKSHAKGTIISGGPASAINNMSGTSASAPMAAGLGALILSVQPNLTWEQVRDIIRSTAKKIDSDTKNTVGVWKDANGVAFQKPNYLSPNYSRWYGYGRIDAYEAVKAAHQT